MVRQIGDAVLGVDMGAGSLIFFPRFFSHMAGHDTGGRERLENLQR